MAKVLSDEHGIECCGCDPDFQGCCTIQAPLSYSDPYCCFKPGMIGSYERNGNAMQDCLNCSFPENCPCTCTILAPHFSQWQLVCVACSNGVAVFLPNGVGDDQCAFPLGFFAGSAWTVLTGPGGCGVCIPCGEPDPITAGCAGDTSENCFCGAFSTHQCCVGQQPGELCDQETDPISADCNFFTRTCTGNVRTCGDPPGCDSVQGSTASFVLLPNPCRLCLNTIFGTTACLEDDPQIFDEFCLDP